MLWFIPPLIWGAIGAIVGGAIGAAIGATLDVFLDWIEEKYPDAWFLQIGKKKKSKLGQEISKMKKSGEFNRAKDDPLGLDQEVYVGDKAQNCIGAERFALAECSEELCDFFSELEEGDIVDLENEVVLLNNGDIWDLETGEVYTYES